MMMRACVFFLTLLVWGCSSPKETAKKSDTSTTENEMATYETGFRPSDYDVDTKVFFSELKRESERKSIPSEPAVIEPPIIVSGFRVQLLSTTNIDEANTRKAEAEAAFPTEWFYIAYDPPAYKLRAGNFLNRADAESYMTFLSENGYLDAWVVPEKVVKNIQPKLIPTPRQEPPVHPDR